MTLVDLFTAALTYPTVWWTVAVGFVILYWLIVAGGGLDFEDTENSAVAKQKRGLRGMPVGVFATAVVLMNFWGCHFALRVTGPVSLLKGIGLMALVLVVTIPPAIGVALLSRPLFGSNTKAQGHG